MKFFIAAALLFVAVSGAAVEPLQQQQQQPIAILRQAQDISPEGSYSFSYETENGISAAESGAARVPSEDGLAVAAEGQFVYTAPDGTPVAVSYVADERGFQPQGAHLPQPHPVPEGIQRALEYIAAHPQPEEPPKKKAL